MRQFKLLVLSLLCLIGLQGNVTKAITTYDIAGNTVMSTQAGVDMVENGVDAQNALQLLAGIGGTGTAIYSNKSVLSLSDIETPALQVGGLDAIKNGGQNFVLVGEGTMSNKVPTSGSWFKSDGSPHWPKNNGFWGTSIEGEIEVNFLLDRYGGRYVDGKFQDFGGFTAPAGTNFTSRALPTSPNKLPLSTYEVIKPFNVKAGHAQPWFGEKGLGTQFQHQPIQDLIDGGYIKLIDRK